MGQKQALLKPGKIIKSYPGIRLVEYYGYINAGSDAGLDNLFSNPTTVEGWFKPEQYIYGNLLFVKWVGWMNNGWSIMIARSGGLGVIQFSAYGGDSSVNTDYFAPISVFWGRMRHYAVTYNPSGDKRVRLYIDGLLIKTSGIGGAPFGDDSTGNFFIGNDSALNPYGLYGICGWTRISNTVRYSSSFSPTPAPPRVDGKTVAQWNMTEGSGNKVDNAEGTAARDGTISNGNWTSFNW